MASLRIHPPLLYTAATIWPAVCTGIVSARFAVRRSQRSHYGWDDWLTLPALFLIWCLSAALLVGVGTKSMGYPTPVISPELSFVSTSHEQTITRKIYWLFLVVQTPTLACVKLSCLAFYLRIFYTGSNEGTRWVLWALITVMLCGTLRHLEYLWTSVENFMKCTVDSVAFHKALGISDVVTDMVLLLFPLPYIWDLKMGVQRKLAVTVIFLFGSLSIATSAVRLTIFMQSLEIEFQASSDQDFLSTGAAYFMLLEAGFGLCTVCLPSLSNFLHLKGVQTFFQNVSSIFSVASRSRGTLVDSYELEDEKEHVHITRTFQIAEERV
ncbi:hypothetical protein EJ05DRAFT_542016 [Pseudovirgaria hyperparasitica]|uniref:Rhodopsin domain-containing protein n=1 Tax=Pseudovirgaria hyperparasitica TaxID=470096 RepID=A0A6A6VSG1_9PEZI|nr:uncharacterized protein EJ05DRAFT_542016 [Pseudovirgaria hyperparasitica]KAF2753532.1 hypothetical protein EJ05DRAFT_542016 [Pseudovirgaria hyperparasitica]